MKSSNFPEGGVTQSQISQNATTALNNNFSHRNQLSADRYYNQSDFEEYNDEKENSNQVLVMAQSDEIASDKSKQKVF